MKDARFSKLKNILILSDYKEGKIIEYIDFKYLKGEFKFFFIRELDVPPLGESKWVKMRAQSY